MKDLNQKLQDEEDKKKTFQAELEVVKSVIQEIRRENPNLKGSSYQLRVILVRIMMKSGVSFPDIMNANECFKWWEARVLPGRDLLEGFIAYFSVDLTPEFASCKKNTLRDTRWEIRHKIKERKRKR